MLSVFRKTFNFQEPEAAGNWSDVLIANKKYTCSQFLPIPVMGGFQGVFTVNFKLKSYYDNISQLICCQNNCVLAQKLTVDF